MRRRKEDYLHHEWVLGYENFLQIDREEGRGLGLELRSRPEDTKTVSREAKTVSREAGRHKDSIKECKADLPTSDSRTHACNTVFCGRYSGIGGNNQR